MVIKNQSSTFQIKHDFRVIIHLLINACHGDECIVLHVRSNVKESHEELPHLRQPSHPWCKNCKSVTWANKAMFYKNRQAMSRINVSPWRFLKVLAERIGKWNASLSWRMTCVPILSLQKISSTNWARKIRKEPLTSKRMLRTEPGFNVRVIRCKIWYHLVVNGLECLSLGFWKNGKRSSLRTSTCSISCYMTST